MSAERLHLLGGLGRLLTRPRQKAAARAEANGVSAQESPLHSPLVVERIQDAEVGVDERIAAGEFDGPGMGKEELAEHFNKKLGREHFKA